jgi:hypothetical protein
MHDDTPDFVMLPSVHFEQRAFFPIQATTDTSVVITSEVEVDLALGFAPRSPVGGGVSRVAAFQRVTSRVQIDFMRDATLYWVASVLEKGQLSPNHGARLYAGDDDDFRLPVHPEVEILHNHDGWQVSNYDPAKYTVNVGFGFRMADWIYWGYSAPYAPEQTKLFMAAGSYVLARSTGAEQIGDPLPVGSASWNLLLGGRYALAFDARGDGTLRMR